MSTSLLSSFCLAQDESKQSKRPNIIWLMAEDMGPDLVDEVQYRDYVRSARDIWDEIDERSRSVTTKRFKYIKNHMPEVPWATDQAYLEINRPALHVMRRLKEEGKLTDEQMTFFKDEKPIEELYDLEKDPEELNNLALDPEYAPVLTKMRAVEDRWQADNSDLGLTDFGKRKPNVGLAAEVARAGIKANEPELWERLEAGELMKTSAWIKRYGKLVRKKKKKNPKQNGKNK